MTLKTNAIQFLEKQELRPVFHFLRTGENTDSENIPQDAESFARVNPRYFAAAFEALIYSAETKRGRSLTDFIIRRLPPLDAHPNEPHIPKVLAALNELHKKPNVKIALPSPDTLEPIALARAQFRSKWIDAIAQACEGLKHIETLQSWVTTVPQKMSILDRSQLCQIVHRISMGIVGKNQEEKASFCDCYTPCDQLFNWSDEDILKRGIEVKDASSKGDADRVFLLLQNGPINEQARGLAVIEAIENDHFDLIPLLLQHGPISEQARGWVIKNATEMNRPDIVNILELNGKTATSCVISPSPS